VAQGVPPPRRFLFFPRGNNNADGSISLYLDYVGPKEDTIWGLCLQFVLTAHSEDDSITQLASRGACRGPTQHASSTRARAAHRAAASARKHRLQSRATGSR